MDLWSILSGLFELTLHCCGSFSLRFLFPPGYPSTHPSVCPSVRPSIHPSILPSVRPSIHPSVWLYVAVWMLSLGLPICLFYPFSTFICACLSFSLSLSLSAWYVLSEVVYLSVSIWMHVWVFLAICLSSPKSVCLKPLRCYHAIYWKLTDCDWLTDWLTDCVWLCITDWLSIRLCSYVRYRRITTFWCSI